MRRDAACVAGRTNSKRGGATLYRFFAFWRVLSKQGGAKICQVCFPPVLPLRGSNRQGMHQIAPCSRRVARANRPGIHQNAPGLWVWGADGNRGGAKLYQDLGSSSPGPFSPQGEGG